MDQFLVKKRNPVLFPKSAEDFQQQLDALKSELKTLIADHPAGRDFYLAAAAGVAVDLRSWLAQWVLADLVKPEEIEAASDDLLAFAENLGGKTAADNARAEIQDIAASSIRKMCVGCSSPISGGRLTTDSLRSISEATRHDRLSV